MGQAIPTPNFVDGYAPAVLRSGGSAFVGPLPDGSAYDFAKTLYQILDEERRKGPAVLAELLRQRRLGYLKTGDPTFLAYVIYGDTHTRLY